MKKATLESTARELTYREVLRSLAGARSLAATNAKLNK